MRARGGGDTGAGIGGGEGTAGASRQISRPAATSVIASASRPASATTEPRGTAGLPESRRDQSSAGGGGGKGVNPSGTDPDAGDGQEALNSRS